MLPSPASLDLCVPSQVRTRNLLFVVRRVTAALTGQGPKSSDVSSTALTPWTLSTACVQTEWYDMLAEQGASDSTPAWNV